MVSHDVELMAHFPRKPAVGRGMPFRFAMADHIAQVRTVIGIGDEWFHKNFCKLNVIR